MSTNQKPTNQNQTVDKKQKTLTIIGIVLCVILVPILIVNCTLIIKSFINKDEVPDFAGVVPLIVLSDSMYPDIKKGDLIFFTRTIDSEYINYERIIPKDNDIFVTVDRERILDALERANIVAEEKIKGSGRSYVKLSANDQFLVITSSSINGKVTDEMDCVHEGKDIDIGFNYRYLINSIKVAEGENIRISLKSANMAITIEPVEEDEEFKYFYMILPVRMNDQV